MYMKKLLFIVVSGIVIIVLFLSVVRFLFGGDEDTWICEDNEWVKHGNPASPMPETPCGEINNI